MEKVKINIVPKGLKPACYVSQNDNGRVVRFELFDELTPYTLDGSETITITVVRPDGVELVSSVVNTEDSYIDVVFNDDMTAIAGIADCELTITDGETVIGSRNFDMNIEIDAYNGKDVVIETATGVIASFNTEVEDNALEYESEIPYNAEGYTGLEIINSRTAPAYDKTPYLFRKTPSGYGNSCIEKLNGLTVAFNQLVENGNMASSSYWSYNNASGSISNNVATFTASAKRGYFYNTIKHLPNVPDRVVLISCQVKLTTATNQVRLYCYGGYAEKRTTSTTDWQDVSIIVKTNSIWGSDLINGNYFRIEDVRDDSWDAIQVKNANAIDLTAMFGSTISDYIYSLETAQAGAGVAYFKALFGADYYEYNAGELMSVKTSGRKTVGFNQYDKSKTTPNKTINGSGEVVGGSHYVSDFIKVLPNTAYYVLNALPLTEAQGVCAYNLNQDFISNLNPNGSVASGTGIINTPDNCYYIRIITDTINTVCFNISDPARDGEYEPYNAVTYPLDPDLELRGIPKLDANNNLCGDGDIYESSGDVKRRYGIVDLGSLNWTFNQESGVVDYFSTQLTDMKGGSSNLLCKKYLTYNRRAVLENMGISPYNAINSNVICISDSAYTDAATFKASLDGVYLIYEKATPTSESADPFTDPQEARITEEFIDNRAIPIPVGHDTIYGTDLELTDIDFNTTIFGGDINAIDGVLTSRYNSDGSVKTTPDVIELDPALIPVKAGDNNIFNSASGAQTIRYYNQED